MNTSILAMETSGPSFVLHMVFVTTPWYFTKRVGGQSSVLLEKMSRQELATDSSWIK
jgi:hypothetical protein